jgi:serine/threonine-protein kinase
MTDARLLGGRYEIGSPLGYGGMAEVHRGRDLRLGRDVAVKVLRSDLARDPGFQARFRREAQNAAALNHPAIVAVYDTGEELGGDNNLPFIVMEYVEGRTLKEVLTDEGPLMPQRALEVTADVCAALDFSHRNGIIHRDIKPGNVMMTPNGTVKVMDFGIARAITNATAAMTQTSAVIGTAQYLSPEQARGETVDARSDVYSTGCLLYELLCGQPPFTGDNPVSVAYQHVREDPVPPGELNSDVTPAIDAIVLKAMAKNPVNRYQTAGDMRNDLLRAAAGRPVEAAPVYSSEERTQLMGGAAGPVRPVEQPRNRKGLAYLLIALAIIGVFAAAAYVTSQLLGNNTPKVSVPSVTNLQADDATRQLQARGFKVSIAKKESEEKDRGLVLGQNPEAGREVDKGAEVRLTVGEGPPERTIPDLKSAGDKAGAQSLLTQNGLVGDFKYEKSAEPKDSVLRQDPAAGTKGHKGDKVTVFLSAGNLRIVPQVEGLLQAEAEAKIREAGFRVKVIDTIDATHPPGTVISQSPSQNKPYEANTTVTIEVARAPEPSQSPDQTAEPSGPPTATPESPIVTDSPSPLA